MADLNQDTTSWDAVGDRYQPLEDNVVCNLGSYCLYGINHHYLCYSVQQHVGTAQWLISGPLIGVAVTLE